MDPSLQLDRGSYISLKTFVVTSTPEKGYLWSLCPPFMSGFIGGLLEMKPDVLNNFGKLGCLCSFGWATL